MRWRWIGDAREVRRHLEELKREKLDKLAALRQTEIAALADEPQEPELIDRLPMLHRGSEDMPEPLCAEVPLADVSR